MLQLGTHVIVLNADGKSADFVGKLVGYGIMFSGDGGNNLEPTYLVELDTPLFAGATYIRVINCHQSNVVTSLPKK